MLDLPIYLDHNATTPCDPRVLEEMMPYFTKRFGNAASRVHPFGWQAAEAVELAREQVASLIGAESKEIVFTSGATESDNLALKGVFEAYGAKGKHLITVQTEHKAVLDSCAHLEQLGARVTYLPVNDQGLVDLEQLEAAICPQTILLAVMYANNEIGVLQPIQEIGGIAKSHGILFFTDAAQAAGKVPLNVHQDGVDLLALSGHKMYGPKGIGALYVRRKDPRVKLIAQMDGGGHERAMRSGTLNVPAIVGLGKACALSASEMVTFGLRMRELRQRLEDGLLQLEASFLNGSREHRLPHLSNLSFQYVDGDQLMSGINKDIAVSSGSACTSASIEPSYVLKALGLSDALAHSSLRFGLGRFTTEEEIDFAVQRVRSTVEKLRADSQLWQVHKLGQKAGSLE
jgi:cysteine desulfurase